MKSQLQILIALILIAVKLPVIHGEFLPIDKNDVAEAHSMCRDSINPPPFLHQQFLQLRFPEHKTTDCYITCLLEKLGLYDHKEGFIVDNIVKQMTHNNPENEERTVEALEKCVGHTKKVGGPCTIPAHAFGCFFKENKDGVIKSLEHDEL